MGTTLLLLTLAAPAPKDKDKPADDLPLGPITEAQLQQSARNLTTVGLALHGFDRANKGLPTNVRSKDGKPLLSWRVQLLPALGQKELYEQFKLDEP